jgi:hypothetical protein
MRTFRTFRRSASLLVSAAALLLSAQAALAAGPTMPAEQTTGSVGPYAILDGSSLTAAICRFTDAEPLKLQRIVVKPPKVQWPDTNADNDLQHGRVRHRIVVQRSIDEGQTWTFYRASTPQTAVAFESTAAPLTKRSVAISIGNKDAQLRVLSKIEWLRVDGSVRGTLLHWYEHGRWVSDQLQGTIEPGPCSNQILH